MGREMRRVPVDWRHPQNQRGHYQPLYDEDFATAVRRWKDGYAAWERRDRQWFIDNFYRDYAPPSGVRTYTGPSDEDFATHEYWEWENNPPDRDYYRPAWPEASRTHVQMYETTSEGTPISPVFATVEELCRWLADTGASTFADRTATYEQWLATCRRGGAPSAVFTPGTGLISGVEWQAEPRASPI